MTKKVVIQSIAVKEVERGNERPKKKENKGEYNMKKIVGEIKQTVIIVGKSK